MQLTINARSFPQPDKGHNLEFVSTLMMEIQKLSIQGIRQKFPFSLLHSTIWEVLARSYRQEKGNKGMQIEKKRSKTVFIQDIILNMENLMQYTNKHMQNSTRVNKRIQQNLL